MTAVGPAAVEDFADALHAIAPDLAVHRGDTAGVDLVIDVGGGTAVAVAVKSATRPSPAAAARMVERADELGDRVVVLVADELMPATRQVLTDAGWSWLDRSGRLRLWRPPLRIDAPVAALRRERQRARALTTAGSRELALLALALARPVGVRQAASALGRSPSTVSHAARALRDAGYFEAGNAPVVPDLFWALAGEWARMLPPPVLLAEEPAPESTTQADRLHLGLARPEESAGWALRGPVAAALWGAPAPVTGDTPPDFFVPDERTAFVAGQILGLTSQTDRACTVTAAPTPWIASHRVDLAARSLGDARWPVAHPVVVALDLAATGARGREVLDEFDPPAGFHRVW